MDTCVREERVISGSAASSRIAPEGRLEGTTVPEVLWCLAQERHTGSLVLERQGVAKTLALSDGRVVFATSSDPEDQLGPFLLRRGEIDLSGWLKADARLQGGQRLGEILVEMGLLAPSALPRAVQEQVREIALSVFGWRDGEWRVTRAAWSGHETITLDLAVEDLILAGTRRVRDWNWVRRMVGGSRAVYRATPASRDDAVGLGLTERLILEQLELPLRVDELCSAVYAPTHDIYRALWALYVTGRVERLERRALAAGAGGAQAGGEIDPAGVEALLLDLSDRRFSGTIRLFRGTEEGALYLRDGRIEFASTNDQEQSLAAHLVRRGVISDRDQDEAVRQLITGKRMGTLLAERGVLLPEDVERFVREQVISVARGLALWTSGEYETDPGATVDESIVLGIAAEDLAVSAWESHSAWHRIWERLGGMGARFRLRPDYLDRLDRMTLRPAMWDVVALLAAPRTLQEILEARPGSDFELCRLLCALQAARVIEREVPAAAEAGEAVAAAAHEAAAAEPESASATAERVVEVADAATSPPAAATSAADLAPELFADVFESSPPKWVAAEPEAPPVAEPLDFELAEPGMPASTVAPFVDAGEEPAAPESPLPLSLELGEPSADPTPGYEAAWFAPLEPEPPAAVFSEGQKEPGERVTAAPAEPEWEAMPWSEADLTGPLQVGSDLSTTARPGGPWEPPAPEELADAELSPTGPLTSAVFGDEAQWLAFQRASQAPREEGPLPVEASEPPSAELIDAVERFNCRHGLVFQQLRLEIGAAIRNLVAACVRRMGPSGVPFEGIVLDRNGHFDVEALARSIRDGWTGDPAEPLDGLIRQELAMVKDLVSEQRISSIEAQLNAL